MKNQVEDRLINAIDQGKVSDLQPSSNAAAVETIGQVESEAKGRGISHLKETVVPHRQAAELNISLHLDKVRAHRATGGPLLATLIRMIAEWLVQFKPSNKEISALIVDTEEGREKVLVTAASGETASEIVRFQTASRQHANRYKFLSRVEGALSNPSLWVKADQPVRCKDGLKVGTMIYMTPSSMLDAGMGVTTVYNTWMNALRPVVQDVAALTHVGDEANARRYAHKAQVSVRRKSKDGRERRARRSIFENRSLLFGYLDGVLAHAAATTFTDGEKAIIFTPKQTDALLERLSTLSKAPEPVEAPAS